jgi:arylamine N-acetyltransferase
MVEVAPGANRCVMCGRILWLASLPGAGDVSNCIECHVTYTGDGTAIDWYRPRPAEIAKPDRPGERRYRSNSPCPECGNPMMAVVIQDYGERKQCEDCRLTVIAGGGVLRWRD